MGYPLRFHVQIIPNTDWDTVKARVLEAEALGFEAAALADHLVDWTDPSRPWFEAWSALGALAEAQIGMLSTVLIGNASTYVQDGLMVTPRGYAQKYDAITGDPRSGERAGRSLSLGLEGWQAAIHDQLGQIQGGSLAALARDRGVPLGELLQAIGQAAATRIGANGLLVAVCAYYHDIGKLTKPEFFTENQRGGENPHDTLAPSMSALVIQSHVKEGLTLAKRYKLPRIVSEGIEAHHGTTLTSYFYQVARRAVEEAGGMEDAGLEHSFRYDGRKPRTREMAVLMLADSDATRFARLGERLIKALSQATAAGFLYRVDMRLRPWGTVGPLVNTVDGYLAYLEQHARLWEKQALLKARPIAGSQQTADEFLARAEPLLLEVELTEPSLFLSLHEGATDRFADAIGRWANR